VQKYNRVYSKEVFTGNYTANPKEDCEIVMTALLQSGRSASHVGRMVQGAFHKTQTSNANKNQSDAKEFNA